MDTDSKIRLAHLRAIEEVFHAALDQESDRIGAFLDKACVGDESLRREVEALLASHQQAGRFIETPVVTLDASVFESGQTDPLIGQTIGRYKISESIGAGGMGVVYLARRADQQYEKLVAIKLIRRGMDTDAVLRHFRNERQILAGFDHPNIARLLDGDTTEGGLPYFVMEYVDGRPIDAYCDEEALSVTERLELFRQVCAAVSYAHRHAVIHRDIKPSNILVSADGAPKLLDFGIAKILEPGDGAEPAATLIGLRLMTPTYASPEQVRGESLTTATDVYSLGVVLYRLLTGRLPYRLPSQSPYDMARAIGETEPQKPSAAVASLPKISAGKPFWSAAKTVLQLNGAVIVAGLSRVRQPGRFLARLKMRARRRTLESPATMRARFHHRGCSKGPEELQKGSPERLRRRLRGDLDNIVLMSLRKEPERRYQSVEQFSEDIRRHLETLPVLARKDTLSYRAGKFIRRNGPATAGAALVVLSLLGGITFATWHAHRASVQEAAAKAEKARAERRFNDVRQLAHSVLFDYYDAIKDLAGATAVRERLVKDALVYLDSLAREASGDPTLRRELAAAYERVGDVRGRAFGASLGDIAGATKSYLKALGIREALVAADRWDLQSRRDLAHSYLRIGNQLIETHEAARGMEYLRKGFALYLELAAEQPASAEIRYDLAAAHNDLGLALENWGDASGALENHRKALSLREELVAADPGSQTHRRNLSVTHVNLGRALVLGGDIKGGLESNRKGLAVSAALLADNPRNADYRRLLAIGYQNDGDYRALLQDRAGALQSFGKKLALDEQSLADDPLNAQPRSDFAYSCERIGILLAELGKYRQALSYHRKALAAFQKVLAEAPQLLHVRYRVILNQACIGEMQAKLGERRVALAECAKAIALLNDAPEDPTNSWQSSVRGQVYMHLARAYAGLATSKNVAATEEREHWRAARDMYGRSLEIWRSMKKRGILTGEDEPKPRQVAREIAKCDAFLRR